MPSRARCWPESPGPAPRRALPEARRAGRSVEYDVFNTASWPRTDLVTLPKETQGDAVKEAGGQPVPSQRLASGELVFLAQDVPALGAKRYRVEAGAAPSAGNARAAGTTLTTPRFTVKLDETTGAIVSLRQQGLDAELVDGKLNEYLYLPGANVKDVKSCGPVKITVKEAGPLVASLLVESEAPSCRRLLREVRVVDGLDRVEIIDQVDKLPVRTPEGLHFGFEFNVPSAVVRINSPLAVVEPEKDQLPGACKNWFSVERWVDVANAQYGVTWATVDAPLVEMGGLTANLLRSQPNPNAYLKTIKPSSKLYSWVMNNHWHTNYRADQEGNTTFRYAIRPHHGYDPIAAARFGLEATEPLIAAPAAGAAPRSRRCGSNPRGRRHRLQAQRRRQGLDYPALRGLRPGPTRPARLEPAGLGDLQRRGRVAGTEGAGAASRCRPGAWCPCAPSGTPSAMRLEKATEQFDNVRLPRNENARPGPWAPGSQWLWLSVLWAWGAAAHPISLTSATVEVGTNQVAARLEVMCEDFVMLYGYAPTRIITSPGANLQEGMKKHTDLLLRDFMIRDRDGQLLPGKLASSSHRRCPSAACWWTT